MPEEEQAVALLGYARLSQPETATARTVGATGGERYAQ